LAGSLTGAIAHDPGIESRIAELYFSSRLYSPPFGLLCQMNETITDSAM
jgi:hypothetical protein